MISLRKSTLVFSALLMVVLTISSVFGNAANAATSLITTQNTEELSQEEAELAHIVTPHIVLNQETKALELSKETDLTEKLKNIESTDINDIKNQLASANKNLEEANAQAGDGIGIQSTCSNMMSILNLTHTTSLGAAGAILGVNPWLVLGVVAAYGIIWTGAGFACP